MDAVGMALAVRLLLNANVDHARAHPPARRAGEFFRPHRDPSANSSSWRPAVPRRATMPHAATRWELPSFILKGWGASPNKKRRSIMMRNIVTGLAAAVIAMAASTLSASAIRGGFGGGGFGRPAFGGGGFGGGGFCPPAFAGPGRFVGVPRLIGGRGLYGGRGF